MTDLAAELEARLALPDPLLRPALAALYADCSPSRLRQAARTGDLEVAGYVGRSRRWAPWSTPKSTNSDNRSGNRTIRCGQAACVRRGS